MKKRSAKPWSACRSWLLLTTLVAYAISGCQGDGRGASVCPTCTPRAGGETTSFARPQGGVMLACDYKETRVSASQAAAEGFAVDEAKLSIERAFTVPLHWHAQASRFGAPASGYEEQTRVNVHASIVDYTLVRLDPALCSGADRSSCDKQCVDWLGIQTRVQVETLDGAVHAALSGSSFLHLSGDSPFGTELMIDGRTDLTNVAGKLRLSPALPDPHEGVFDFNFAADGSAGELYMIVMPTGLDEAVEVIGQDMSYQPLMGAWGTIEDLVNATPSTVSSSPTP